MPSSVAQWELSISFNCSALSAKYLANNNSNNNNNNSNNNYNNRGNINLNKSEQHLMLLSKIGFFLLFAQIEINLRTLSMSHILYISIYVYVCVMYVSVE